MSVVREMYKNEFSEKELDFIINYKYKGKTADEWNEESKFTEGVDEKGNQKWMNCLANATDAIVCAKLHLIASKQ